MSEKELRRENHYVPKWYQRGFTKDGGSLIQYLDLEDRKIDTPNGEIIVPRKTKKETIANAFCIRDLYSTFFGTLISDEIEDKFFGEIDDKGSRAVRSFIENDEEYMHRRFMDFFEFMDIQKLRTVKGLDWIKNNYTNLDQNSLLFEMQALRKMNVSIWIEGVREIVSAKNSDVKFILSDNPITTYNYSQLPEVLDEKYPEEPGISLKATQTIFPLNMNQCLILTNYEYANNPDNVDPLEKRTNPQYMKETMVNTLNFIRERELTETDVLKINYIIKKRAKRFIAGAKKEWLFPEKIVHESWDKLKEVLLPPKEQIGRFGGEMIMQFEDGTTKYQDAFGRSTPAREFLQKDIDEVNIKPSDYCGCGSGKVYKVCCKNKDREQRSSWKELSIRERNVFFIERITEILINENTKSWDDIRREFSSKHVKEIYELYELIWPIDTDIVSLLPKKDGSLRVLYSGIVDVETVEWLGLGLTVYFDQVLIQNPMLHPLIMSKDFSPLEYPEKYLQQTFKHLMLLMRLLPYIENGSIILFPNLGDFNHHLRLGALNASKERYEDGASGIDLRKEDPFSLRYFEKIEKDIYLGLKDKYALSMLLKNKPHASKEEQANYLEGYNQLSQSNPTILLQKDLAEGQMQILSHNPTLEMSLFICQITGSVFLTHSKTRWNEIKSVQQKTLGMPIYNHEKITKFINSFDFKIYQDSELILKNKKIKNIQKMRDTFFKIYKAVEDDPIGRDNKSMKKIKSCLKKSHAVIEKEFEKDNDPNSYYCKLDFLIPNNGFESTEVKRLILQNLGEQYNNNLSIAIFISFNTNMDK